MMIKITMEYICRVVLEDMKSKNIQLENAIVIVPYIHDMIIKNENVKDYFDISDTRFEILKNQNFVISFVEIDKIIFTVYSDFNRDDKDIPKNFNHVVCRPTSTKLKEFDIYYRSRY